MKRDISADVLMMQQNRRQDDRQRPEPDGHNRQLYSRMNDDTREMPRVLSHEHARELIREQTHTLLPPDEANALADHLVECDSCFKYAQDIAHEERQSGKHNAVGHP